MIFSSLRTASFRNIKDETFFIEAKDIFLVGKNGQGKTNFLEAVYFCSYASSFRTVRDNELARNGEKDFAAELKIKNSINENILVKFEKNKKTIFINGKRAEDRKALLSIAPVIVFCHEDMEFVSGSPEKRRWFFDQTLCLYDPVYLDDLHRYRRVLKTRNAVLRDNAKNNLDGNINQILEALDPQLAEYGVKLIEKRITAATDFSEMFSPLYEEVCGIDGIQVQYNGSWSKKFENEKNITVDKIIEHLKNRRETDIAAGISLSGPHRDRYIFIRKNDIEDFSGKASTGQRRLLALLLRTAQSRRFSLMTGLNPILLLDDVLLEMDSEKRQKFIYVLPAYDQAFYTFLPDEPYSRYKKDDTLIYKVEDGNLKL